jgi:hypothetical protein
VAAEDDEDEDDMPTVATANHRSINGSLLSSGTCVVQATAEHAKQHCNRAACWLLAPI